MKRKKKKKRYNNLLVISIKNISFTKEEEETKEEITSAKVIFIIILHTYNDGLQDSVATGNTPEERSPIVTAEVTSTPANVTLQQEEHGDEESSSEKDEETHPGVTHKDTQDVAPSDSPAVEQVTQLIHLAKVVAKTQFIRVKFSLYNWELIDV